MCNYIHLCNKALKENNPSTTEKQHQCVCCTQWGGGGGCARAPRRSQGPFPLPTTPLLLLFAFFKRKLPKNKKSWRGWG